MPVTFTPIGTAIDAAIVEGNFDEVRRLVREQVKTVDSKVDILDRWSIAQYIQGRIAYAETRKNILADEKLAVRQKNASFYDGIFRDTRNAISGSFGVSVQQMRSVSFASFELLGRPGPSFYWQYQEDAFNFAGTPNDPKRFPDEFCYSEWLTVPGASLKLYVPYPCVVRMKGTAHMIATFSPVFEYISEAGGWTAATNTKDFALRLGLVVDTNPILWTDEFANTNVNLKTPGTSTTAPYKSFQFAEKKNIYIPQWTKEDITGELHLKGGRWYNFSMKYHHAGTRGYVSGITIADDIYEASGALPNFTGGRQTAAVAYPSEIMWVSTSLALEFIYGYDSFHQDSTTLLTTP